MKLNIQTAQASYPIYIGTVIETLSTLTKPYEKVMVITDQTVHDLHIVALKHELVSNVVTHIISPGESSKSVHDFYDIQTSLIEHQFNRHNLILAFGGGVVGDLAGFVAATYMRGIDYMQVPTTLLAHDSAVGGKVAINHELGKNLMGAFYQPKAVIYHLPFLETLSAKEWRSGFAEMLKHSFIADEALLYKLLSLQTLQVSESLLSESLNIKARLVEADVFERGVRAYLNFGHTLGHALEKAHPEYSHGEAVAIGMAFRLYVDNLMILNEYKALLQRFSYPLWISEDKLDDYVAYMSRDKKNHDGEIAFVRLIAIGQPQIETMNKDTLRLTLKQFIQFMKQEGN